MGKDTPRSPEYTLVFLQAQAVRSLTYAYDSAASSRLASVADLLAGGVAAVF